MREFNYILLLHKKMSGQLEAEELQHLNEWLEDEDNASLAAELQYAWKHSFSYKTAYEPDLDAGLSRFKEKIEAAKVADPPVRPKAIYRQMRWSWVAAIVLLLAATWWFWPGGGHTANIAQTTISAEMKEVLLPDGSRVLLNENSELLFPESFQGAFRRVVELKGEAYFDVEKDAKRPFIIQTTHSEIKVLGTSFNVRAYEGEPFTEVEVESGVVEFKATDMNHELLLKVNDRGVCMHEGDMYREDSPGLNAHSWRTGQLKFRNTVVKKVVAAVARHFSVTIELSGSNIADCSFGNTDFSEDVLPDIFENFELTFGVEVIESGKGKYALTGGDCKN